MTVPARSLTTDVIGAATHTFNLALLMTASLRGERVRLAKFTLTSGVVIRRFTRCTPATSMGRQAMQSFGGATGQTAFMDITEYRIH